MTHVITVACIGEKKQTCVETCPVDCIIGADGDLMLFIDPGLCIDCAACVPACPVNAIYLESDVPEGLRDFIDLNRDYFVDPDATRRRVKVIAEATV